MTASAANAAAAGSMEDVAIAGKGFELGKNLEGERGIGGGGADTCSSISTSHPIRIQPGNFRGRENGGTNRKKDQTKECGTAE